MRDNFRKILAFGALLLSMQIAPIVYDENNECVECDEGRIIATIERGGSEVLIRSELLGLFDKLFS
jgi:hypothetical protein